MRIYSESNEEALRAHSLLRQWKDDGHLGEEQYRQLEQDTNCDLRTTNIFLRLVLLLFTLLAAAAAVALFFKITGIQSDGASTGITFLVFAVLAYIAAEIAVAQAHLYRYGIEEALAICSVAFVCIGVGFFFRSGEHFESTVISGVGAGFSLWLWHRFGLWYAFPAAMIFTVFLPGSWTQSHALQRCCICIFYAGGLALIAAIRSRHRWDWLEGEYSLAEAFLWLGIYLVLNLKLSAVNLPFKLWGSTHPTVEFTAAFYWTTWVLIWCLPAAILVRGIRQKDRFVIEAGAIAGILTLITNKPYLGWPRHTWDPMLLGVVLIGIAVFLFRWLARGPGGVRHGFTAARVTGKHKHAFNAATSVLGLLTPQSITPASQPRNPEFESGFGGGSGGGGATGDF